MDDIDVIEFDQNRGTIELGPNAAQLDMYLEDTEDQPWHKLYLSVALFGGVLFALTQIGATQFGLTPIVVLSVLLFGVTAAAAWHTYTVHT